MATITDEFVDGFEFTEVAKKNKSDVKMVIKNKEEKAENVTEHSEGKLPSNHFCMKKYIFLMFCMSII